VQELKEPGQLFTRQKKLLHIGLTASGEKGIVAFFFANSGSRTMAGEKTRVVRQSQKPLSNGIVQS
jgi:hypothetical protein